MPQVVPHDCEIDSTWQHVNLFSSIEFSEDAPDIDMEALAARYVDAAFWHQATRDDDEAN